MYTEMLFTVAKLLSANRIFRMILAVVNSRCAFLKLTDQSAVG